MRFIVLVVIVLLIYWLVRNVVRAFLRGLAPGNGNQAVRGSRRGKQEYRDVQDADFTDITDEK